MSNEVEQQLLIEACNGDMDSYEELQLLLAPPIQRFVARLVNDPYIEDDIVQDVFIKFYQHMHRIDPVSHLRPYIFRIARNRCYDELRRKGRYDEVSLDDEPVQVRVSFTQAHTQPQPDDITHWLLLHLEVREAIDQLPESQRQALILYSEENMSYAEIAEIMEVSIGTVKSRIYYAKKNLRQYLRPETIDVLEMEFAPSLPAKRIESSSEGEEQDERTRQLEL